MAAHALAGLKQVVMFPEPAQPRGPSLVDRLEEVDVILATLESLEDSEHSESYREELQAQLITAIAGTRDKIDRTAAAFSALHAAHAAAKVEMERQQKRMAQFLARITSLEGYVLATLTASNLEKLDGHHATFTKRDNPPAVCVEDESQIPAEFMRTPAPPPPCPDKTAIKEALKLDPAAVPGCRLTRGVRLVRS